jgi:nitrile hydratase
MRAAREDGAVDGVHDLGGMHGFGAVSRDEQGHPAWEERVAMMAGVVMASTTIDRFRHTIEQMPPAEYLSSRYYERWLWAIERMAAEQGLLDGSGHPEREPRPAGDISVPRRFADGQRVRVTNPVTPMHTRVPRYIRNHEGRVVRRSCAWPHPTESAATGRHGPMEHVYAVEFAASDVFGADADHVLVLDIWERDLELAATEETA